MSGTALLLIVPLAVLFGAIAVLAMTELPHIRRIAKNLKENKESFCTKVLSWR
jgi:hypothetical protein